MSDNQAAADDQQDQAQNAPPPADPVDEIEHLAQLHGSGALTDDEFTAAKAKSSGPDHIPDGQKMLNRPDPGRNRGLT